jgi:hypothetical protein
MIMFLFLDVYEKHVDHITIGDKPGVDERHDATSASLHDK